MKNSIKTDDVILNFFKQICDEKDDKKCVELGNNWIKAMETSLKNPIMRIRNIQSDESVQISFLFCKFKLFFQIINA